MSEFILGDCLEYMRKMPDNAYDLAIVDPPYGDGMGGGISQTIWRNVPKINQRTDNETVRNTCTQAKTDTRTTRDLAVGGTDTRDHPKRGVQQGGVSRQYQPTTASVNASTGTNTFFNRASL